MNKTDSVAEIKKSDSMVKIMKLIKNHLEKIKVGQHIFRDGGICHALFRNSVLMKESVSTFWT